MATPNRTTPVATERQLQAALKEAAERLGFLVFHAWSSIHSPKGFPDLFLCHPGRRSVGFDGREERPGRCLAIEVKGPKGRVSDAQHRWIETLGACGIPAIICFPDDEDRVLAILRDWAGYPDSLPAEEGED